MTKLLYLTDSYKKETKAKVISIAKKGSHWELVLDQTIFYPQGGGQLSDKGIIKSLNAEFTVTHVRMHETEVIHEGKLKGELKKSDQVDCAVDWNWRYLNMRRHSAGHILHDVVMQTVFGLKPLKADHGKQMFIEYQGNINPKLKETLEKQTNMLVAAEENITTEFVTYEDLLKKVQVVPEHLPKNKPLRIMQIDNNPPVPDGGTQVKNTADVGRITIVKIESLGDNTKIYYEINLNEQTDQTDKLLPKPDDIQPTSKISVSSSANINLDAFRSLLLEQQKEILEELNDIEINKLEELKLKYFGSHGKSTLLIKNIRNLPDKDRKSAGMLVNEFKKDIASAFANKSQQSNNTLSQNWFDITMPGVKPPQGHLHVVTQAIMEITRIFEKIGFTRVRHPEVDWDWYAFESLNMPPNHPARDEWETFFINYPFFSRHSRENGNLTKNSIKIPGQARNDKRNKIVLTPQTSNGQVREMEKGRLPIRMINIAKCYRRQIDISHTPMFHQFEGMYIDKNVSIAHLKGVFDYFVKHFYGPNREIRLRPFHFQFTEPSFEVDINCGICLGKGILPNGHKCKLCKSGWLEMAGSGMVHPVVLKNGGVDPEKYSGFAFGWGVERAYMMKNNTQIDDIRLIYSNDIRFLEQF